jgi:hypothetical protein
MAKLSIIPAPVFTAPVPMPVPGGEPDLVAITFKHRTADELAEFVKTRDGKLDVETFPMMVTGWDFAEDFTPENIALLLQNRPSAGLEAFRVYVAELTKFRQKN